MKRAMFLIVTMTALALLPSCNWTLGKYCKYPEAGTRLATDNYFVKEWSSEEKKCDGEKLYRFLAKEFTVGLCDGDTYVNSQAMKIAMRGPAITGICNAVLVGISKWRGPKVEKATGCDGKKVEEWYMKGSPVCVAAGVAGAVLF